MTKGFNPRTRIGCDPPFTSVLPQEHWFQSTHPYWVRRIAIFANVPFLGVSIHAPVLGATAIGTVAEW